MIVVDCSGRIADAFSKTPTFWLNTEPPKNIGVNGFAVQPESLPQEERSSWQKIGPTNLTGDLGAKSFATDDWPFLYLRDRLIPDINIRSMILLGVLGIAMVYFFMPKGQGGFQIDGRMFFLGAAFMLLETKAVVQLALLFGSTWLVNSLVFSTALVLILLANLYVLRMPNVRLVWHYAGLTVLLLVGVFVPLETFLNGGMVWRYVIPAGIALGPCFSQG